MATNKTISELDELETLSGAEAFPIAISGLNNKVTSDTLKDYCKTSGSELADEEDITVENNKLKFKNRSYDVANFSGLGYVVLRKNIVDGINILTQDMISDSNTIYEIRYDFDLNGENITIPENCELNFQGGSIVNGTLALYDETKPLKGTGYVENFGAKRDDEDYDNYEAFYNCIKLYNVVELKSGTYYSSFGVTNSLNHSIKLWQ